MMDSQDKVKCSCFAFDSLNGDCIARATSCSSSFMNISEDRLKRIACSE
jgi:hypothetical protein